MSFVNKILSAINSGTKHLFMRRFTLRYPEKKFTLQGEGYQYDPKNGVGIAGYRGRHILYLEKCTGCSLCFLMCKGISQAIEMINLPHLQIPVNKKSNFPQIDYTKCVYCGFCVLPNTMVLTNPDLKPISQIEVGDLVLTHTGEYRPVSKVWDLNYTGPLYSVKAMGKPDALVCTKDHPILAVRRARSNRRDQRLLRNTEPLGMLLPHDLKLGDYLVTPIPKKTVDLKEYRQSVRLYRGGSVKKELILSAEQDLFRLIGYYLAEGFCSGGRTVRFSFGSSEQSYINDVSELLRKYFGKGVKLRKNTGKGVNVVLHSAVAEAFFSNFGNGAQNKRIPDWILLAPVEKQAELVKGLWFGDGSLVKQRRQDYFNFTTTSKTLAMQLQLVLSRLGVVAAIHAQQPKHKKRVYRVNVFGKYARMMAEKCKLQFYSERRRTADKFHITNDYVLSPISKIDVYYAENQRVIDVTVDLDHTFVPEGVVTSNCVDACPFLALFETNDYEVVSYDRESLLFTPEQLAIPPKKPQRTYDLKYGATGAYHA